MIMNWIISQRMERSCITSLDNRIFKKSTNVEEWKKKIILSFCMLLHICCIMLYVMYLKSMVSSLEKLYSGLDPDDATLYK